MKRFVQKLRRILWPVVGQSRYRHDPLLINTLIAFNFRPPITLEFPIQKLVVTRRSNPPGYVGNRLPIGHNLPSNDGSGDRILTSALN